MYKSEAAADAEEDDGWWWWWCLSVWSFSHSWSLFLFPSGRGKGEEGNSPLHPARSFTVIYYYTLQVLVPSSSSSTSAMCAPPTASTLQDFSPHLLLPSPLSDDLIMSDRQSTSYTPTTLKCTLNTFSHSEGVNNNRPETGEFYECLTCPQHTVGGISIYYHIITTLM